MRGFKVYPVRKTKIREVQVRGGEQADFNIFVYRYGERQVAPPRSPANVEHTWRVVIARLLDWRRRSYVTVLIVRAIQIGGATTWRWRSARGLFTWVSGSRENTCSVNATVMAMKARTVVWTLV